jgi:hypothetical protein
MSMSFNTISLIVRAGERSDRDEISAMDYLLLGAIVWAANKMHFGHDNFGGSFKFWSFLHCKNQEPWTTFYTEFIRAHGYFFVRSFLIDSYVNKEHFTRFECRNNSNHKRTALTRQNRLLDQLWNIGSRMSIDIFDYFFVRIKENMRAFRVSNYKPWTAPS